MVKIHNAAIMLKIDRALDKDRSWKLLYLTESTLVGSLMDPPDSMQSVCYDGTTNGAGVGLV